MTISYYFQNNQTAEEPDKADDSSYFNFFDKIEGKNLKSASGSSNSNEPFKDLANLLKIEEAYSFDPHYLTKTQPDYKWAVRAVLLDWLSEITEQLNLRRETYYCAVNYIDRFLAKVPNVLKEKLQVLAIVSLFIAAKKEVNDIGLI